jgi:dihydrofolate reductase
MRKIITNTFISIDGVMQAPGAPEEDRSGDFQFGGWIFNYQDEVMDSVMRENMSAPTDLLLGRKTYEIFAAHWPFMKDDPTGAQFDKATKYVATNTLTSATWKNTKLLKNFVDDIKALKISAGPDLMVHGSGNMIQSLLKHNLIDEMNIWIFPLLLGKGKKLFENGALPSNMKLKKSITSTTGVVITQYVPGGEIKVDESFAMAEPSALELERRKKVAKEG